MNGVAESLRTRLHGLGFDEVRFAGVQPAPSNRLRPWLAAGMQADMAWMTRSAERRLDPDRVLPGVRAIIVLGVSYAGSDSSGKRSAESGGMWARYALHRDYHDTIRPALAAAGRELEAEFGIGPRDHRYYVDTGPVLERGWAERTGLGFIGKNTMLISRRHGNWLLLSAILTRAPIPPDPPPPAGAEEGSGLGRWCGTCTRCLDACPTQAFPEAGVLDARRCISYHTIENPGVIPQELRAGIGMRVFGCDICLEVCPWNRFASAGRRLLLEERAAIGRLSLRQLLTLTPPEFAEIFRGTAVKRLKLVRLLRNACVAAGNSGDPGLVEALVPLTRHSEGLVRAHAVWAVYRLAGAAASSLLAESRRAEVDPVVLREFAAAEAPVRQRPR